MLLAGALAVLMLCVGPIGGASAADCDTSWGNQDGDWTKPSNWSNGLPGAKGPNVCITEPGTYTIHVTARPGDFNNSIASAPNLILGGASGKQTIAITGTFTDQTASASLALGSGTIGSNGQIVLSSNDPNHVAGASICAGDPGLVNEGTISFEPGSGGGRTMQGKVINKGAFNVNTDTVIPGVHSCGGNGLTNAGGTVNIATGKTLDATDAFAQSSGTTNVNGALDFHGGIFTASGGTFTGNNPVLTDPPTFSPSGGTGTFVVRGSSAFGSSIGSGITVIGEGTATHNTSLGFRSETKPATNSGTIKLTSSDAGHSASLFAPDADANALTNAGTIETLTGSGGDRLLGLGITNASTGTIKIGADTGSACCNSSLKLANAGTLTIDANKTFSLGGSPFTQTAGTTTVNGAMTGEGNSTFALSGGSFAGNAPVLTGKTLALTAGSGAFVLHGQSSYATGIGQSITLTVEGTAIENGSLGSRDTADGATNSGTIKLTSTDAAHNAGLYAYDSDASSLKNAGTIETLSGSGGDRSLGLGITNEPTGTIKIGADTNSACCNSSLKLANAGTLTIDANKTFSLGGSPFTQTAGAMAVEGALNASSPVTIQGGTLRGTGTVTAPTVNNTGGTVHPGNSPGLLSINGNYTQGAGGKLAADIAGSTPGSGYSRLAVSGAATLAGTLDVTTIGFTPAGGQTFQVLTTTGARSGTFTSTDVHGSTSYDVKYNPADVTLVAHEPPAPPNPPDNGSTGGSSGSSGGSPPPITTPAPKPKPLTCKKGLKKKKVKGKFRCVRIKHKPKRHKR